MNLWAVLVAGGSGTRFGGPKQLATLAGKRVVDYSIEVFSSCCDGVVLVGPCELGSAEELAINAVVAGGETRSASVRAGLAALPPECSHVLIHDAARPLASKAVIKRVTKSLEEGNAGVVPVVPLVDTLRKKSGGSADRSAFVRVQTPQGFVRKILEEVHCREESATDDASLLDQQGIDVAHVDGDEKNFKITIPLDLAVAEVILHG